MRGRSRSLRKQSSWLYLFIALVFVNIVAVAVVGLLIPEVGLGEAFIELKTWVDRVRVEANLSGQFVLRLYKPPENVSVSLLIGNYTMGPFNVDIVDTGVQKIGLIDIKSVQELSYSYFSNISFLTDVRLRVNIEAFEPFMSTRLNYVGGGCYEYLYLLPSLDLNTTVYLCYYYLDPYIEINNGESSELVATFEIRGVNYSRLEEITVQPRANYSRRILGYVKPPLQPRELKLSNFLYWVDVREGYKVLDMRRNIHLVLIPPNLTTTGVYYLLRWRRAR